LSSPFVGVFRSALRDIGAALGGSLSPVGGASVPVPVGVGIAYWFVQSLVLGASVDWEGGFGALILVWDTRLGYGGECVRIVSGKGVGVVCPVVHRFALLFGGLSPSTPIHDLLG
jgi:hypothetical protein